MYCSRKKFKWYIKIHIPFHTYHYYVLLSIQLISCDKWGGPNFSTPKKYLHPTATRTNTSFVQVPGLLNLGIQGQSSRKDDRLIATLCEVFKDSVCGQFFGLSHSMSQETSTVPLKQPLATSAFFPPAALKIINGLASGYVGLLYFPLYSL